MTTEEYTEFVVFAKIFLQSKKFKGGADFRDIAHQVIADNENATMDECKLLIKKEYGSEQEQGRKARNGKTKTKARLQATKDAYHNNMATSTEFKDNRNKKNREANKARRIDKPEWKLQINETKKVARAAFTAIRKSVLPQICWLFKLGKCIRNSERKQYKVGNTCPQPELYDLDNNVCYPINKIKLLGLE